MPTEIFAKTRKEEPIRKTKVLMAKIELVGIGCEVVCWIGFLWLMRTR
jgi:hypothetical protein